jgi:predicted dehydrogenase
MYRAAIVGCTGIGREHAAGLAGLANVALVAACDLDADAAESFREDMSDFWDDIEVYSSHRAMLAEQTLDVVTVATGDNAHATIVVDAARAGVRGIFCEKPLATSIGDADRMIAATQHAGTILSVDHTRRWQPLWKRAHERVTQDGAIGAVRSVIGALNGPRAMLFRNGTHLIDAICWFAGGSPDWVFAHLEDGYEHYGAYAGDGGHVPATEPAASGYVHFDNGVRGFYTAGSKATASQFSLDVVGETGRLIIDDQRATLIRDGQEEVIETPPWTVTGIPAGAQEIVRLLDGDCEPSSPGDDAHKAVEITMGFLASQQRGNARVDLR